MPLIGAGTVLSVLALSATAWAWGVPWRNHAPPLTFLFGNHIDTHQQARLTRSGSLAGFLYITYTGATTPDGYRVARHCDENTPAGKCVAGWALLAKPAQATFLYHNMDHPVWLVSRSDIPQPGAYAHFHWITDQGTDPRPVPDPRCNVMMADDLQPGAVCPGYFLELVAVDAFAFEHGGRLTPVDPGIDIATHVNVVTSVPMDCDPMCVGE
jgi:hypothetical protein